MKHFLPFALLGALLCGTVTQPVLANEHENHLANQAQFLRGEAYFLERIALPPNSRLHVSLTKSVGSEFVPLSTIVTAARNGSTPFRLSLPKAELRGTLPYRLQAWITSGNRVVMKSLAPQMVSSLSGTARIRMSVFSAPSSPIGIMPTISMMQGTVTKLDRRALSRDARIVITLSDVLLADAPAREMYRQEEWLRGAQLPFSWNMGVRADWIKPGGRYALRAQIYENGRLTYTTDSFIGVTPQNLTTKRELLVRPMR